jgi:hypothetical protein
MANRYRNIVSALENLLVQLGTDANREAFFFRIQAAKEVYQHEMMWHINQDGIECMIRRNLP